MKRFLYSCGLVALMTSIPAMAAQDAPSADSNYGTGKSPVQANEKTPKELGASPDLNLEDSNSTADMPGANTSTGTAAMPSDQVKVLSSWTYEDLYTNGYSVGRIFDDTTVVGKNGDDIGDVENLILGDDGKVLAVIAQVGGFWDIGDTHVSVPWSKVKLSENGERMTVPVNEDNLDQYSVFGDQGFFSDDSETLTKSQTKTVAKVSDDLDTGPSSFKATDLIGDYAYLGQNIRYGYVNDLVISNGQVSALVVDAAPYGTRGYYAYPYAGYGVRSPNNARNRDRYNLPYAEKDVKKLQTFDYDRLRNGPSARSDSDNKS